MIPGLKKDQNSYRAELGGQLAIATFVESVDVSQGNYYMKTACDGLAALNKVGINAEYIKCSAKHVDMISMISELLKDSSFTPLPAHVYGHQDASKKPLSMLAILNNNMDIMAKQIALNHI